jgi:micrococcal nuclease
MPLRRFRPRRFALAAVWLALLALVAVRIWTGDATTAAPAPLSEGLYSVTRVVDGDTLIVAGEQTIRLMGVNTPETVKPDYPVEPWGPEASEFTRQFLANGEVRLQFDRERVDRYGRLLAYVWVGERMLNEELVRAGLATFEPQYHYAEAMKRRLRAAQDEARQAERGIWSSKNLPAVSTTSDGRS